MWKRRFLFLLPTLLTLPIVPLGVLSADDSLGEFRSDLNEQLRVETGTPRLHYFFTQFRVIVTYLRLLVLPVNQNLDYDFPISTTFFIAPVLLSFLLLTSLFGLAVYLHLRSRRPHSSSLSLQPFLSRDPAIRLISFGIFWFFLTLAVESSLIPIADVIFEHRLYLPSIGMAAAIAILIVFASQKSAAFFGGRIPLLASALIILGLTTATYQRNLVWGSSVTLWEDVVRKSPEKARPWNNLGAALSDAGRLEDSILILSKAIQIESQNAEAWHNLGRSNLLAGRNVEAVRALRMAVRFKPDLENAIINLAVALIHSGQSGEAASLLEKNLHRFPDRADARINLGVAYVELGDYAAARRELAVVYRLAPQQASPLADLINRSVGIAE